MTSPRSPGPGDDATRESASPASYWRTPLILFLVSLVVYALVAGDRLRKPSPYNHFVYLADSLLHGQLSNRQKPPNLEDWARVETLTLRDGRVVKGTFLKTGLPNRFRTLKREELTIPRSDIAQRKSTYYVSFPPLPAFLMMPGVLAVGYRFNDVVFNVFFAALNVALVYLVLRRLRQAGHSRRTEEENLWLTVAFGFGTVHFFSSVLGQVWYTGQLVGVTLCALYVLASIGGERPLLAGLCLALGFTSRAPLLFAFPLLVAEVLRAELEPAPETDAADTEAVARWRALPCAPLRLLAAILHPGDPAVTLSRLRWGPFWKKMALFALPFLVVGVAMAAMNYARFGRFTEFGHTYLDVRWTPRIQKFGLFNYAFLSKNLSAAFTLLPKILSRPPYVRISWHGMSLLLTTPLLVYLIWPRRPEARETTPWRGLWVALAVVAFVDLLYQNTGWVQFGYRFMLDWAVFAFALLALNERPIGRLAKGLIVAGIVVNTFGALTFQRATKFYYNGFFPSE